MTSNLRSLFWFNHNRFLLDGLSEVFCNYTRLTSTILTFLQLVPIVGHILPLKLSHFLNFIEVNNKALLLRVLFFNAFPAKDCLVIGAIKVHHSLLVILAQFGFQQITIIIVKIDIGKYGVSLNYFIENIDIQWKPLYRFEVLDEFSAERATNSEIVMKMAQTLSAESMPTMY